jgi:hypothetical protein
MNYFNFNKKQEYDTMISYHCRGSTMAFPSCLILSRFGPEIPILKFAANAVENYSAASVRWKRYNCIEQWLIKGKNNIKMSKTVPLAFGNLIFPSNWRSRIIFNSICSEFFNIGISGPKQEIIKQLGKAIAEPLQW